MNENAKKWVAALRSGEYKQTKGCLNDDNGFCCLGVACEIYEKETGVKMPRYGHQGLIGGGTLACTDTDVQAWLGLRTDDGTFSEDDYVTCLTSLNDDENKTFEEIADIIESEPKGLFIGD